MISTCGNISTGELHRSAWLDFAKESFLSRAKSQVIRSRLEFAQTEITLPVDGGPFEGRKWRPAYQPAGYHLLKGMDECGKRHFAVTGAVQSGKTMHAVVIPALWHLFERKESVGLGISTMDLAGEKWRDDFLPVIESSPRLRAMLPQSGRGSKGGTPKIIEFRNGTKLRFMSSAGNDATRSGFTVPVIVLTEVDRYDLASDASREASPIHQMFARTQSRGDDFFAYEECTCTIEDGRIWQQYCAGTQTQLFARCPHCGDWQHPSRENFVDVTEAASDIDASESASFFCLACGEMWSDQERKKMLQNLLPVDGEQSVEVVGNEPKVVGAERRTRIFSFRWNAFHNAFWTPAFIGSGEWRAARGSEPEREERERRQVAWTIPATPGSGEGSGVAVEQVLGRSSDKLRRRDVPPETICLSAGADLRKTQLHFVIWAHGDNFTHMIDCGIIPLEPREFGVRKALLRGLRTLRDSIVEPGYAGLIPTWCLYDGGYKTDVMREFQRECNAMGLRRYMMAFGRGTSEADMRRLYSEPQKLSKDVSHIGRNFYVKAHRKIGLHAVFVNSDAWKSELHDGLQTPVGEPGSITTWEAIDSADKSLARAFARQVAAEKASSVVIPGRGPVTKWTNISRTPNHFFDAAYYGLAAGEMSRLAAQKRGARNTEPQRIRTASAGSAYLASER